MAKKKVPCPHCHKPMTLGSRPRTLHVGGYSITATLPASLCEACGHVEFAGPDVARFYNRVGVLLSNAGIMSPEVLRFLRKLLGLREKELGALLGVRAETISRWENGKTPIDRPSYMLLRQLVHEQAEGHTATMDHLRKKPQRLKKKLTLPDAA